MFPADDGNSLARLFHLNSEPWINAEAALAPHIPEYKQIDGAEIVPLSPPLTQAPLTLLLAGRRSCRSFSPQPVPLNELGPLFSAAVGFLPAGGPIAFTRPVPSAGDLYPLDLNLLAANVEGLAGGVYHYNVPFHCLESIRGTNYDGNLGGCFLSQAFVDSASAVAVISARFVRTQARYGPRGYRYALLEAGHVAQNLTLLAAERGIASVCLGGFHDVTLNAWLGLDGVSEAAVYCVALGYAA